MMRQKHSAAGAASPAVCSYFKEEFLIRGAAASGPRERTARLTVREHSERQRL